MAIAVESEPQVRTNIWSAQTAVYTPPFEIPNRGLVRYFRQTGLRTSSGKWPTQRAIIRRTGIDSRQSLQPLGEQPLIRAEIVPWMANQVAQAVVKKKGWQKVDCLFTSTSLPYRESLSLRVAKCLRESGISVNEVFLDTYVECTSPALILHIIRENSDHFLRHPKIVIVASEYVTSVANGLNMSLPSDGAAAIAFDYGDDLKVLGSAGKYFPEFKHLIRGPVKKENLPPEGCLFFIDAEQPQGQIDNGENEVSGLQMEYGEIESGVLRWAIQRDTFPPLIEESLRMAGIEADQIDLVIPHRANGRITEGLKKLLPIYGITAPIYSNIRRHGNTASVSMIQATHEAKLRGRMKKGRHILYIGFGLGMFAVTAIVEV